MKRLCINLKKCKNYFAFAGRDKSAWTLCLPFDFKVSRKALSYLRKIKVKLIRDQRVKELYLSGDPKKSIPEGDYTLNMRYVSNK